MNGNVKPYGIIAEFRTTASVMHAAEKVRDAGFRKWDVFTPFPVHGMDRAMGLKNSKGRLVYFHLRRDWLHDRHADDLVDECCGLSSRRWWQAYVQSKRGFSALL